jgi:uncharacterized membrane protein
MPLSDKPSRLTFKRIFFTGILVTFPTALTLFIFYWLASMIDILGGEILGSLTDILSLPRAKLYPGIGFIGTVTIIFSVGLVASNYFGKKIYEFYETLFYKIPFLNLVFSLFKKVLEMVLAADRNVFRHAVLVEFPRKGLWIIGFLSASAAKEFNEKTRKDLVSVFIPTTPNPTTAVLMLVPKKDLIMLDMSIEDASKIIISGGILTPEMIAQRKDGKIETEGDPGSPIKPSSTA